MSKQSNVRLQIILYCFLLAISAFSTVSAVQLIQYGAKGEKVEETQGYLYDLNYLKVRPTGYYGRLTVAAVKAFQRDHNLKVDGKIGSKTYKTLKEAVLIKGQVVEHTVAPGETLADLAAEYRVSVKKIMAANNLSDVNIFAGQRLIIPSANDPHITSRSRSGRIQAISWPVVNQLWQVNETVRIIDLRTGRSFMAKRRGGHYHSDTEPLTSRDTQILLSLYGGRWSWERRPVAVQIHHQFVAASINGMPHGRSSIPDNHFNGHFCVHFLGSRLHLNSKIDPDHQSKIQTALALDLPSTVAERQTEIPVESRETR